MSRGMCKLAVDIIKKVIVYGTVPSWRADHKLTLRLENNIFKIIL